jgi:hypothetical protein
MWIATMKTQIMPLTSLCKRLVQSAWQICQSVDPNQSPCPQLYQHLRQDCPLPTMGQHYGQEATQNRHLRCLFLTHRLLQVIRGLSLRWTLLMYKRPLNRRRKPAPKSPLQEARYHHVIFRHKTLSPIGRVKSVPVQVRPWTRMNWNMVRVWE